MMYRYMIDVSLLAFPISLILCFYLIYIDKYFPRQGRRIAYFILGKPIRLWRMLNAKNY